MIITKRKPVSVGEILSEDFMEPMELTQDALAEALGKVGVTRICALGHMTSPEAGWHHDGRFSLLDLIQMVDIEASAEAASEALAAYVD